MFDDEPVLGASDPLLALPNALCIPHLGYVTRETILHHYRDAIDQIAAYCAGQPINVVNPEAVARGGTNSYVFVFLNYSAALDPFPAEAQRRRGYAEKCFFSAGGSLLPQYINEASAVRKFYHQG